MTSRFPALTPMAKICTTRRSESIAPHKRSRSTDLVRALLDLGIEPDEVAEGVLRVGDPFPGVSTRADRGQVRLELLRARAGPHQLVDQEPALRIRELLGLGIGEQVVLRQELLDRDPRQTLRRLLHDLEPE